MIVGVPREIKQDEYRVGMLPVGVEELTRAGHRVLVERGAGLGSGIFDDQYAVHGAEIVGTAEELWSQADLVVKVKEPLEPEMAADAQGTACLHLLPLRRRRTADERGARDRNHRRRLRDAPRAREATFPA